MLIFILLTILLVDDAKGTTIPSTQPSTIPPTTVPMTSTVIPFPKSSKAAPTVIPSLTSPEAISTVIPYPEFTKAASTVSLKPLKAIVIPPSSSKPSVKTATVIPPENSTTFEEFLNSPFNSTFSSAGYYSNPKFIAVVFVFI
uniref:Flocculation protein FLO11-like n=1 Tax=Caenorhabditis tropicalis TaxID=1561998 RepID=A0A1I7UZG0_9PELO